MLFPAKKYLGLTSCSYNEYLRLTERYLEVDIPALQKVIAVASNQSTSDIVSFSKLPEGGLSRLFQAISSNGKHATAKISYPCTEPEHYTVASEAATLDYLRLHGIATPKVYSWYSTRTNPVGTEYIIMEKLDGTQRDTLASGQEARWIDQLFGRLISNQTFSYQRGDCRAY